MAQRAPLPCRHPGCCAVVGDGSGYCAAHQADKAAMHRAYGQARKGRDAEEIRFYNSSAWKNVRRAFLVRHPLCEVCEGQGRVTPANVVDHRQPMKEGGERYDFDNLRALCVSCHNRITARQTNERRRDPFAGQPAPLPRTMPDDYTF